MTRGHEKSCTVMAFKIYIVARIKFYENYTLQKRMGFNGHIKSLNLFDIYTSMIYCTIILEHLMIGFNEDQGNTIAENYYVSIS